MNGSGAEVGRFFKYYLIANSKVMCSNAQTVTVDCAETESTPLPIIVLFIYFFFDISYTIDAVAVVIFSFILLHWLSVMLAEPRLLTSKTICRKNITFE